ncbi:hypothetical protein H311_01640 [Anncaliia algerae PRA109]|nr:hypothetical protein H311_01640 [Anncaliia algerae PRA109]
MKFLKRLDLITCRNICRSSFTLKILFLRKPFKWLKNEKFPLKEMKMMWKG